MKCRILLLFFLILLLITCTSYKLNNDTEQLTDIEAISNVGKLFNDGDGILTNLTITGNLKNDTLIPPGTIVMWAGAAIPAGWVLCDGTNGTPDLRGRFIMGANTTNDINNKGGSSTHTHDISNLFTNIGFTWDSIHGNMINVLRSSKNFVGNGKNGFVSMSKMPAGYTDPPDQYVGISTPATNINGVLGETSHVPPYYTLAYIMRVKSL